MKNRRRTDEIQLLKKNCSGMFGEHVVFGQRAIEIMLNAWETQSLPRFGTKISLKTSLAISRAVLLQSPACADILSRNGLDILQLRPSSEDIDRELPELRIRDYRHVLAEVFTERLFTNCELNESGEIVKSSGVLTEIDIFSACLEAGRLNLIPNATVDALFRSTQYMEAGFVTEAGDLLLKRLENECRRIAFADPSHSSQQFLLFLDDGGKLRVRPFGTTGLGTLDEASMPNGPFCFRGGTFQISRTQADFTEGVIAELEDMINSLSASEQDFQMFFEQHPRLLAGLDFGVVHPHPILHKDDGGRLVPDFFLENVEAGTSALLDLKTPLKDVVVRRPNRVYFSQHIQNAISQLQYYREWFENAHNRSAIERKLKLSRKVFRPRIVLVAGRSTNFIDEIERIRLITNQRDGIDFWTYDDVLARAKRYQAFLRGET